MNYHKYLNSAYLKEHPLCGIGTYKDELNLVTGACTRKIQKLVLDGTESWEDITSYPIPYFRTRIGNANTVIQNIIISTHLQQAEITSSTSAMGVDIRNIESLNAAYVNIRSSDMGATLINFKAYLSAQYAGGTPVTVWYALSESTSEIITIPSGLSGTIEGYLNQSGTPTPTNPIYPTANNAMRWYDIEYHKRASGAWTDVTNVYERDNGAWTNT
mgnify:CR=1 FL=1